MKKKISFSIALAIVLTLLATVAAMAFGLTTSKSYSHMQAARSAIMEKYDFTTDMVRLMSGSPVEEDNKTTIVFTTTPSMFMNVEAFGEYTVVIDEKGKATASWSHDDVDPSEWKDGDLTSPVWGAPQLEQMQSRYELYLKWDKDNEYRYDLSLEDRIKKYEELEELIAPIKLTFDYRTEREDFPTPPPLVALPNEAENIALAKQELNKKYGITDEMLLLFRNENFIDTANEQETWVISFLPKEFGTKDEVMDWRWMPALSEKQGTYVVKINPEDGTVTSVSWSLEGVEDDSKFNESNWATAKAYSSRILPWALDLLDETRPIIQKYPEGWQTTEWFTVEDAALYDEAFRNVGFTNPYYNHELPKQGDLTAEEALTLGKQALQMEFNLTDEQMAVYEITTEYLSTDGGTWEVRFWGSQDMGYVLIHASDGVIQMIYLDSGSTSNG